LDSTAHEERFIPVADALGREDDLIIRVELPGIDPHKHASVFLRGNVINVTGRRTAEYEGREAGRYFEEICYGSFNRDFTFPEEVTEDAISAEYRDGILEITVARAAKKLRERPARRVEIASNPLP
jgi:HSP20 family protein